MKAIKQYKVNENLTTVIPYNIQYSIAKQSTYSNCMLGTPVFCNCGTLVVTNCILLSFTAAKYNPEIELETLDPSGDLYIGHNGVSGDLKTRARSIIQIKQAINETNFLCYEVDPSFRLAVRAAIENDKNHIHLDAVQIGPALFGTWARYNGLNNFLKMSAKGVRSFLYVNKQPEGPRGCHYFKIFDECGRVVSFGVIMNRLGTEGTEFAKVDVTPTNDGPVLGAPLDNIHEVENYYNNL